MPLDLPHILTTAPLTPDAHQVAGPADRPTIRALTAWPTPRIAIYGRRHQMWMPGGALLVPLRAADSDFSPEDDRHDELEGWSPPLPEVLRQIPRPIREALAPLPLGTQWRSLQLVAAVPEALELFRDNPTLAGWLADRTGSEFEPEAGHQVVREVLRGPRREMLEVLGLPISRWMVRALAKTDPAALLDPGVGCLKEALGTQDKRVRRWLQHLEVIPADVIEVLGNPDLVEMVEYSLLTDPQRDDGSTLGRILALVGLQRDSELAPARPPRFSSWTELLAFQREHEASGWTERYPGRFEMPTGEVWLPGDPVLRLCPTETAGAMARQAREQRNCISSAPLYPTAAWLEGGAMYSLSWGAGRRDQTGTVWLRLDEAGRWELREVEGFAGRWLKFEIGDRIQDWIDSLVPEPEDDEVHDLTDARAGVAGQLRLPFDVPSSPLDVPAWTEAVRRLMGASLPASSAVI